MDDLISRQAAIDALRTCYDTETITMDNGDEYINYGDAVGEIEQLPSAHPEPPEECERCMMEHTDEMEKLEAELAMAQPKRGKWIKTARWGRVYYCDQCRNYLDFDGVNAGRGSTNFCPNCGADMRGGTGWKN